MASRTETKRQQSLQRWIERLRQALPSLSLPEVKGLALWSIGIVLARSCSLHAVVLALSCWLTFFKPLSLRRRLQEWYYEADAKKGHGSGAWGYQRRDLDVPPAAADLLGWILSAWPNQQLVLALDPTNFGDRFTVLNISVLYRGCAIPVIWTVVEGGKPGAWEPHWERMLKILAERVPVGWQVLVLADRGMYSPSLFRCLRQLHWHPFLRIRAQGFYRRIGSRKWLKLENLRPKIGETKAFQAEVFKNAKGRLECTLVAFQGEDYAEPWLIVTDLSAEVAQASWYGLRGWIEHGYKQIKSEGWNLPRTRIRDPQRLQRLWLAVAVATMWVVEVGGEAEVDGQQGEEEKAPPEEATPNLPDLNPPQPAAKTTEPAQKPASKAAEPSAAPQRIWSVFARGWNLLRNALACGVLLLGSWHPEPWPDHPCNGLPGTPPVAHTATQGGTHPLDQTTASATRTAHKVDSS
jgi:Transposase DDE domain